MNTSSGRVMSRDCFGETRRSYGQRLLCAVLLTIICHHTSSSGNMGRLARRSPKVCLQSIRITFSFLVKTRLRMQWRHTRCRRWQQGRKLDPLPCGPLEIEVKSHHKIILQISVKTLNKHTKIGKLEKNDWTTFSYTQLKHISEIMLPTKPLAASPQAAWDQGQETYPMSSWARNGTPATFQTHADGREVQHLYLALQCTCSSAVLCTVKICCPPSPPPLNSESGISSRTDPGLWYILRGLLNTDLHQSSAPSHRVTSYRSATIFCGISALSQMTF